MAVLRTASITGRATFDNAGRYRYMLARSWDEGREPLLWILQNPSDADEAKDDSTICKCVRFARDWNADGIVNAGGIVVCNLFAFRSQDPTALWAAAAGERVGPENDETLLREVERAQTIVAGWGGGPRGQPFREAFLARERDVKSTLSRLSRPVHHLGLTRGGHPRHPLFVRTDVRPTLWPPPTDAA